MRNGDLVLVTGASRSGKSRYVNTNIDKHRAVIVWDPQDEYGKFAPECFSDAQQLRALWSGKVAARRVRVHCPYDGAELKHQFSLTCMAGLAYRSELKQSGPVVFVAEELADVTNPGKATQGWGMLQRTGRKRNITTYGITQSPAESDKTIVRNANIVHCCALGRAIDRRYMEKELDLPRDSLNALNFGDKSGDFVHWTRGKGAQWGSLNFSTGRTTPKRR